MSETLQVPKWVGGQLVLVPGPEVQVVTDVNCPLGQRWRTYDGETVIEYRHPADREP